MHIKQLILAIFWVISMFTFAAILFFYPVKTEICLEMHPPKCETVWQFGLPSPMLEQRQNWPIDFVTEGTALRLGVFFFGSMFVFGLAYILIQKTGIHENSRH